MKDYPVGARWVGTDPKDGKIYTIELSERRKGVEIWHTNVTYSDGSHGPFWRNWATSYQQCRRQLYLDGSAVKMRRVK